MKIIILSVVCMASVFAYSFGIWSEQRLEDLLRTSGRFVENDYDEDDEADVPNWERNALPLFQDVMEESGWSTNHLVLTLISIASNGLTSANWESPVKRKSAAVALSQLSDINHPLVTNYFHTIVGNDLHGLESIVIPAIFKYTRLEPAVFATLYHACSFTNSYDKAAPSVAMGLIDGLGYVQSTDKEAAKARVAKFMYFSMRQVSSSQTWQDEQLAKLIPSYSNSVERLEQMRYLMQHSTRAYEREKATAQFNRLKALPTNALSQVQWIRKLVAYPEANLPE